MRRRILLMSAAAMWVPVAAGARELPPVEVVKAKGCSCCEGWVKHMRAAGFTVAVEERSPEELEQLKRALGLPEELWSCHTARVAGYVIEGHVPSEDVVRLLDRSPIALGLAVPGMPAGSPGMEVPGRRDPYDTLLVGSDGRATVFARHR